MGKVEEIGNVELLKVAANKSLADQVIRKLPHHYDQMLGRRFDGGVDLSGGEWQQLALARAFMRDCQLLVLDEPTAALDVQTEYDVYTRFHDLTHDRMTLLISHRFSTVRMADRILYLADGSVQEEGSHADLIARDGAYARLYSLQTAPFLDDAGQDLMVVHA